jgi:hypothetical protein
MDRNEDFLQHWGIKGMKWDSDKKKAADAEYRPHPTEPRTWINNKGDMVYNGSAYPNVKPKPAPIKKSKAEVKKAADAEYKPLPNPKNEQESRMWINGNGDMVLNGKGSPNTQPKSAPKPVSKPVPKSSTKPSKLDYKPLPNPKNEQERRMWINGKGDMVLNGKGSPNSQPKSAPKSTTRPSMTTKVKNISSDAIKKGKSFIDNLFKRGK